jgi:hypothetical protein
MKYIDATSKDGRYIKVSDDVTYQEVGIYCENVDQANELVAKLTVELLKEN